MGHLYHGYVSHNQMVQEKTDDFCNRNWDLSLSSVCQERANGEYICEYRSEASSFYGKKGDAPRFFRNQPEGSLGLPRSTCNTLWLCQNSYWKWWFSSWIFPLIAWWFSIAMLNYQRVSFKKSCMLNNVYLRWKRRTVVCCYKGYILSAHSPSSEDSVFIDSFCGQWIIYARYQGATFPFFDRWWWTSTFPVWFFACISYLWLEILWKKNSCPTDSDLGSGMARLRSADRV